LGYFNQALPIFREIGNHSGEATTLTNIGGVYLDLGEKQKLAKWTVMLYMAADTTTDDNKPDDKFNQEAEKDLMEIKAIGSTDEVNFLAQWDGIGKPTPVYHLCKGTTLEEDIIHKVREVNMGNIKTLLGFFDTCTEAYPAEHYMFIIWGHGNGWSTDNFWDKKHVIPPRQFSVIRLPPGAFTALVPVASCPTKRSRVTWTVLRCSKGSRK
jgi:hypothetical protein